MVASYSELYEEGEVENINGVWQVFLLKQLKLVANYVMTPTSGGVVSLPQRERRECTRPELIMLNVLLIMLCFSSQ